MWKILYVRAWVLAAIYIGLDTWTMCSVADYGSVNVVAHVAGGFAGYLYGYNKIRISWKPAAMKSSWKESIKWSSPTGTVRRFYPCWGNTT